MPGVLLKGIIGRIGLVGVFLAALTAGCREPSEPAPTQGRLIATVAILPQAYFVERIGGEHVDVQVLVGPGQSPHSYEPTPKQMSLLAESRVYFQIGLPFEERLLAKITQTAKGLHVVDTREGIQLRKMEAWETGCEEHHDETDRDDGHRGDDHGGAPDPHVWLSPRLAKIQVRTMSRELCRLDPPHAADYERNTRLLEADLDEVDRRIEVLLAPMRGQEFFVFHPAFGYFADAYGLKQVAVETGGKQPGAKQLAELIEKARASGVKLIFVQRQFPTASAEAVARAIGGTVAPMDDLAKDYLANIEEMAKKIAAMEPSPRRR